MPVIWFQFSPSIKGQAAREGELLRGSGSLLDLDLSIRFKTESQGHLRSSSCEKDLEGH